MWNTILMYTAWGWAAPPIVTQAQDRPWEWGWSMHPMGWMWSAWGIGMMGVMLAFWALVLAGVVVAIRWLARQGGGEGSDRALHILRERYARGEIDKQEFDAKRRDLS